MAGAALQCVHASGRRPAQSADDHEQRDDRDDHARHDYQPPPEPRLARRDRAVRAHVVQRRIAACSREHQPPTTGDAPRFHGCLLLLGVGAFAPVVSTCDAYRGRRGPVIPPSERMYATSSQIWFVVNAAPHAGIPRARPS